MPAVPAAMPVTIPVPGILPDATVALAGLLVPHVPPVDVLDSIICEPSHTHNGVGPVIAAGVGFTVIVNTLKQVPGVPTV